MKRCFIVSVGTSLIANYLKDRKANFTLESLEKLPINDLNTFPLYNQALNNIRKWLNNNSSDDALKKASAELSSLYKGGISPPGKCDICVLIATNTATGILSRTLLKEVLEKKGVKVFVEFPQGLGSAADPDFAQKGLPEFISCVSKNIQKYEKDYEVVLIPTGGYKSLIPYMTLAGIVHEKEIKYIYEDSDVLLTLPHIPLGIDLSIWKANYQKLQVITTIPKSKSSPYYNSLPPSFQNLLEEQGNDQPYKLSPLGNFLMERYLNLRYKTPLRLQTERMSLLDYLKRDNGPDLREMFGQLTEIGSYLWIGDKLPDMIDHALYHHNNLFEIAELILLPILEKNKSFLSPEELFILLCTIYFHDCGHILSYLPGIKNGRPLLLTEIRDFHHILGYERLKDTNFQKLLWSRGLKWGESGCLWVKYLEAIATIGLYHRKNMPLTNDEPCFTCPINEKKYKPLQNLTLKFEDQNISPERAVFLAALFRVIDSLDNQVTRTGAPGEIEMKAAVMKSDAEAEKKRRELIAQLLPDCLKTKADDLVNRLTKGYSEREGTSDSSVNNSTDKIDIEKELNEICDPSDREKVFLYIDAAIRAFFKEEQPKHYLKHLALKNLIILPEKLNNHPYHIGVNLKFEEKSKLQEYANWLGVTLIDYEEYISKIAKEISDDYNKVKGILNSKNLFISITRNEIG